jgi:very-short-patch-repair endonuclease
LPTTTKLPKALSAGEEQFWLHCKATFHPLNLPLREYQFAPPRMWRLDFFFERHGLAVEIEGGVHRMGRHQRPEGFINDIQKYNSAALMGITVLRYTPAMVKAGTAINEVIEVLTMLESRREAQRTLPAVRA